MRLTLMTRSQASASTSRKSPQASVPAAVTIPRRSPCRLATRSTAASAARPSVRSTRSYARPSAGGLTSRTTGVPPASRTAAATAAPSPEAPPVTMMVPSPGADPFSAGTGDCLLDELRGGAPGHVGHEHDATAPGGERLRLRQVRDGVVAALDPDVRAQALERARRLVLLEDEHRVDAAQRPQDGGAVGLRHERAVLALEPAHGGVGVQEHDQAVALGASGLEHPDVAGVQQVEAAAGGDDGPAAGAHARGDG